MSEHVGNTAWLIEVSSDGTRQSVCLIHASLEDVAKKLVDLTWYSTYEEAMTDEGIRAMVASLLDKDNWHEGVWYEDGEQCWSRVSTVDTIAMQIMGTRTKPPRWTKL